MEARPRTNRVAPNQAGHGEVGRRLIWMRSRSVRRLAPLVATLMKTPVRAANFTGGAGSEVDRRSGYRTRRDHVDGQSTAPARTAAPRRCRLSGPGPNSRRPFSPPVGFPAPSPLKAVDCLLKSLRSCQTVPADGLHAVPPHAPTVFVHPAEAVLGPGLSLVGRTAIPTHRLHVVPRHALTVLVHRAEVGLRDGKASFRRTAVPADSFR